MGNNHDATLTLTDALFSNVQQRVLGLIFGQPDRSFYTSEILRAVQSGTGAVERELARLQRSGLITVKRIGNQKHYQANRASPVYPELFGIVQKTVGLVGPIADSLRAYANTVKAAFVFGSVAKGTQHAGSDIDLMVIGENLDYPDLYSTIHVAEAKLHRKVDPLFLSYSDWTKKRAEHDSFVQKISEQPKIFIIGSENELRA